MRPSSLPSRSFLVAALAAVLLVSACASSEARLPAKSEKRAAVINLIRQEARNMGVSVPLALAVAHAESYFNPRAESHVGARGVMQIMPATSRLEYGIHPDLLWDARINIRLGLHFLRRLLGRYQGRVDLALSYYNGGSRVGDLPNARVIPATRKYVRKVLRLKSEYRAKMYAGELPRWKPLRRGSF
ncbi:MAG: lytic transglycosylase domain-containing protein [Alphaproteobacteria bacterium]